MAIKSTGLTEKGIRSEFFRVFRALPQNWQKFATVVGSTADSETYKWIGNVPQMREFIDARRAQGVGKESYSVTNKKYELTLEVDRDEIADDQTGQIMTRVQEMAKKAATHNDYLMAVALMAGDVAGNIAYDGLTFWNTAHYALIGSGSSCSNKYDLACTTGTVPTMAELVDGLDLALVQMAGWTDENGDPLVLDFQNLWLVAGYSYINKLIRANTDPTYTDGSGNLVNNRLLGRFSGVWFCPWLTDSATKAYILRASDFGVKPFVLQQREPLETSSLFRDSAEEFHREKYYFGVRERKALAYGAWYHGMEITFS